MTYPHERVRSSLYFRGVLQNMVGPTRGNVTRFGITGGGEHPNYQVETPDGEKLPFQGANHKPFLNAPGGVFDPGNLTGPFTYEMVQDLLRDCGSRR